MVAVTARSPLPMVIGQQDQDVRTPVGMGRNRIQIWYGQDLQEK